MNRRALAIVLTLAVLIGGSVAAYAVLGSGASTERSSAPIGPVPATTDGAAGAYVDYSDTAIAEAEGTTILFFHAPWCPQCRAVESDILASGVPAGVTIIKVDFDSRQDLRQRYDVTIQTTFLKLDGAGNEVERFVAYDTPTLQAVIDAML